jgi:hypothetical protein
MNIHFARRVQLSIMDEKLPFNMNHWDTCIAGHCHFVAKSLGIPTPSVLLEPLGQFARRVLEISHEQAHDLFCSYPLRQDANRHAAVARLDVLIAQYEPRQEPSLRGEAPSRSPRATPETTPAKAAIAAIAEPQELVSV